MNCNENPGLRLSRWTAVLPLLVLVFSFLHFCLSSLNTSLISAGLSPCNSRINLSLFRVRCLSEPKIARLSSILGLVFQFPSRKPPNTVHADAGILYLKALFGALALFSALFSSYHLDFSLPVQLKRHK